MWFLAPDVPPSAPWTRAVRPIQVGNAPAQAVARVNSVTLD